MRRWVWVAAIALVCGLAWGGAVIEVGGAKWYRDRLPAMGGLSLTRGYAPFPVHVAGYKSTPRWNPAVSYEWDWGDGSPKDEGFVAAHVYREPGVYWCALAVRGPVGDAAATSIRIEVLEPDGPTYYVDAELGDDANPGASPERAWRSAAKALGGLQTKGVYPPGTRVLFRRGQTFFLTRSIVTYEYSAGPGVCFGAFGDAAERPIIRAGNGIGHMLHFSRVGARHVTFRDLVFDGTSPDLKRHTVANLTAGAQGILWLNCGFRGGLNWIQANVGMDNPYPLRGVFAVGCDGTGCSGVSCYVKASDCAYLSNVFENSGSHIFYASHPSGCVWWGNVLRAPAWEKPALRIAGAAFAEGVDATGCPTEWVEVRHNLLQGVTRADGRSSFTLASIAPNVETPQLIRYVEWAENTVQRADTALEIGDATDVVVRDNLFDLSPSSSRSPRIKLGSTYDDAPSARVLLTGNTFILRGADPLVYVETAPLGAHSGLQVVGNYIDMSQATGCLYRFDGQPNGFVAANTIVGRDRAVPSVQLSGHPTGPTVSLGEWCAATGNEPETPVGWP